MDDAKKATRYRWEDLPWEQLNERLERKMITGERIMITHIHLKQGCVVPLHAHENEQVSYVLSGALRFWAGSAAAQEEIVVRAGEVLHLPPGLPHKAEALADTLAVDVFSPPRQDWLDKTDDYLRG